MIRRAVPYALLPLSLIACALASSPWLRVFPASIIAVPLFGAALLSVIAPLIIIGIGVRRLWLTALIEAALLIFYQLLVTLREPGGFGDLYTGLVHGPSQILTFAVPLVSPRSLMVVPVALCWISGALIGECVARAWQTVVPYVTLLVVFGLSYAGTARGISTASHPQRTDTLIGAALLLVLLLLRAAQAWVVQEEAAEQTQPDGVLPLRGLAIGTVLSVVIAVAAAGIVQASAFGGRPTTPGRAVPVHQSAPLTPVSFISGLRPDDPKSTGSGVFTVTINRAALNYVALASVDTYDGNNWSFTRTFRPSGGVIPADVDPELHPPGDPVTQIYSIAKNSALTTAPWMPYLERPQRVTGTSVNVDADSGMIVPTRTLRAGDDYTVRSTVATKTFDQLGKSAQIDTAAPAVDTSLDGALVAPLSALVTSLAQETNSSSGRVIPFLQAIVGQFRTRDSLAGKPASASSPPSSSGSASSSASPPAGSGTHASSSPRPRSSAKTGKPGGTKTGKPGAGSPGKSAGRSRSARKPGSTPSGGAGFLAPFALAASGEPGGSTPPSAPPSAPSAGSGPGSSGARSAGTTFADVLASIRQQHSATPEQYATLTALIARQLGVPARVVTGFRVTPPCAGSTTCSDTLPAGTYNVTASEAWTWVEIPIVGQGWVVLDPSPASYVNKSSNDTVPQNTNPTPSASPSDAAQLSNSPQTRRVYPPVPQSRHSSPMPLALVIVLIAALLVALFLVFLLYRKQLRARRRRRAGDPRRRLLGAWQESLDVLQEAGLPDLTSLTSTEIADATAARFGPEPADQARHIGAAANVAIFSPTTWIGADEAAEAWRAQVTLSKAVRRRLGWQARVRARLSYHRPPRVRPIVGPSSWAASLADRRQATARRRGRHTTRRR